ncbi:hypothetical protein [Bacillus thuringiensis]|uniref:hypothetical protein n=1 Tax=Bacillus thuringiensis TaxID=1428 RepID=UPI003DA1695C
MKLRKVIATLLFPMIILSACSTLTEEEYLDAVAKEEVDVSGGIKKANDKSLSITERKENIEKRISLLEDSKKLSAPSEFKDAHKEYVKQLELEMKNLEKEKENLNRTSSIFDNYSDKDKAVYDKYNNLFLEKLGVDAREKLYKKNRDLRRVSREEYIKVYQKEIKEFLACFKDAEVPTVDGKVDHLAVMDLVNKARGHLTNIIATVPPKELNEAAETFKEANTEFDAALDALFSDPKLTKGETGSTFMSSYLKGLKLNKEFMEKVKTTS